MSQRGKHWNFEEKTFKNGIWPAPDAHRQQLDALMKNSWPGLHHKRVASNMGALKRISNNCGETGIRVSFANDGNKQLGQLT